MSFVYPTFLFALFAIAVPILIHLFNLRKFKKIYFSNVKFLENIEKDSRNKRKIRDWLILLSRMLAIAALVFVFAQPIIPGKSQEALNTHKKIIIYLDDSFSMDAESSNGRLFDIAKNVAFDIINIHGNAFEFKIISNDIQPIQNLFHSLEDAKEILQNLETNSARLNLDEILNIIKPFNFESGEDIQQIYIISDFQKSQFDFTKINYDSLQLVTLIPIQPILQGNLFIDTLFLANPDVQSGRQANLKFRLQNRHNQQIEDVQIRLLEGDEVRSQTSINIDALSNEWSEVGVLIKQPGFVNGKLSLQDSPITYDDDFFFSLEVKKQISIYLIKGESGNSYCEKLFSGDAFFDLESNNLQNIDFGKLKSSDLVILENINEISSGLASELTQFLKNEGNILLIPGANARLEDFANFQSVNGLSTLIEKSTQSLRASKPDAENPFVQGIFEQISDNIDMPVVNTYFKIRKSPAISNEILKLNNGDNLLIEEKAQSGKVFTLLSPLGQNAGNLSQNPVLIAFLLKIAFYSQKINPLYLQSGSNKWISFRAANSKESPIVVKSNKVEFIPEQRRQGNTIWIAPGKQNPPAGIYEAVQNEKSVGYFAINHSPQESFPELYSKKDLLDILENPEFRNFNLINFENKTQLIKSISEMNLGVPLWKIFVILALIFILFEILLIRFFKV